MESKYKQLIMGAALAAILSLIVVFPEAEAPVRITSLIGGCRQFSTSNKPPPLMPAIVRPPKSLSGRWCSRTLGYSFLGSDDFPRDAKALAARDLNAALEAGWSAFDIAERIPLSEIARAHELVEHPVGRGRIVVIP